MRRGRRTILIAGATLASVAATGGCSSLRDDAASRSSLVMVGDSITFMSLEPLHAMFAAEGFTEVTVDAVPGRPIAEGVDIVELVVASGPAPDVWVVALGTNDLYYSTDVTAYRALVDSLLVQIPKGAPVVWVDTFIRDRIAESRAFNEALAEALDERGDAQIARWFARCESEGELLLASDGVHPTEAGAIAFADVVRQAIES